MTVRDQSTAASKAKQVFAELLEFNPTDSKNIQLSSSAAIRTVASFAHERKPDQICRIYGWIR